MEVLKGHVHIFLEAPPRYAPAEVVQIMKNISGREEFKKFTRLRNSSGRESWGMMVILSEVLDQYQIDNPPQLTMFDKS
jgi:REP element-mobilizing transposase RayT